MDGVLCDHLLEEIIQRVPPSCSSSVSLVSKRWLSALRASTTSLTLSPPCLLHLPSLSAILTHYPSLSSLSILPTFIDEQDPLSPSPVSFSSDALLLAIAASPCASRLTHLRFASAPIPITSSALLSSSFFLSRLTHLHLSFVPPISFCWLARFPFIKSLSLVFFSSPFRSPPDLGPDDGEQLDETVTAMLPLETLSLSGVRSDYRAMSFIWRRCGNLRRLRLRSCQGTGDGPSSPFFPSCLAGLLELELRTCRSISDRVLLRAADRCRALNSLLLYDGGSSEALQHFIRRRAAALRTIDLRLPLDLHNGHLTAIALSSNRSNLSTLRLHSCFLVTGDGLRAVANAATGRTIQELALVSCDVVEREPGLLSFLGQSFPRLQRLDLSYNDTLKDKELGAMLTSCACLVEIKLRGCSSLTDATVLWLLMYSRLRLEYADLSRCPGISLHGIEILVLNFLKLGRVNVEKEKISETAMAMASRRAIQLFDSKKSLESSACEWQEGEHNLPRLHF